MDQIVKPKGVISQDEYSKLSDEEKLTYWKTKDNNYIEIKEMDAKHLQRAFCYAQSKELIHHNNYSLFAELVESMETVAKERGIKLKDINTDYHKRKRKYQEKHKIAE